MTERDILKEKLTHLIQRQKGSDKELVVLKNKLTAGNLSDRETRRIRSLLAKYGC